MQAIAPNLTAMVGELVGARLIAHAGSLTFHCAGDMYSGKLHSICRKPSQSGKAACLNSPNFWGGKGSFSSFENKARHTKIWDHFSCISCRTIQSTKQRKGVLFIAADSTFPADACLSSLLVLLLPRLPCHAVSMLWVRILMALLVPVSVRKLLQGLLHQRFSCYHSCLFLT